jgi:predicted lipid-binding transport protein (Tim44 family)
VVTISTASASPWASVSAVKPARSANTKVAVAASDLEPMDMSVAMWVMMGVMMGIMMGGMIFMGLKSVWRRVRGRGEHPRDEE